MTTAAWGHEDIGDLTGRVALVTGANSGVGYETALRLAQHGAHVVLACRDAEKGERAMHRLEAGLAERNSFQLLPLDLSDLYSVRAAAAAFRAEHPRLDLLVNNAGIMGTPYRQTPDGFELQMATNHLGPFALTGLLLDCLLVAGASRVVTVSSQMHRMGALNLDDVAGNTVRNTWTNYGTSKLANLLFTSELNRRLEEMGARTVAVAAHPGWTRSNLMGTGASMGDKALRAKAGRFASRTFGQDPAVGALPSLYAATAPSVQGGQYIGPRHLFQLFGPPKVVRPDRRARDAETARRLWEASESLTEVSYSFHPAASR